MDISNSLINPGTVRPLKERSPLREDRQLPPPSDQSSERSQPEQVINAAELTNRGQQIEQTRVQRLNNSESATFNAQQALDTYQQTEIFAQQFEEGELVGIDLFV